jgi:hypothetical protein
VGGAGLGGRRFRRHDGEGFEFIRSVGDQLSATVGSWLGTFYWAAGFAALSSTNLAVLDMVGRVTADILKVGALRDNETCTEDELHTLFGG